MIRAVCDPNGGMQGQHRGVPLQAKAQRAAGCGQNSQKTEAPYPSPRPVTMGGVPYSIFPRYFKKRSITWKSNINYSVSCVVQYSVYCDRVLPYRP